MIFTQKEASNIYTLSSTILSTKLGKSKDALSYLEKRGISKQTVENCSIGFAPSCQDKAPLYKELCNKFDSINVLNSKIALPTKEGEIVDFFSRDKIIFPIYEKGSVIGFTSRTTLPLAKTRFKTLQFEERMIYNIDSLLYDPEEIYLVEGPIDTLSLIESGIPALGILGTQNFGVETAQKIKYYSGRIICMFDTDKNKSGQKGRNRLLSILYEMGLRNLFYKEIPPLSNEKRDVNDLLVSLGKENMRTFIESLELRKFSYVPTRVFSNSKAQINLPILDIVKNYLELTREGEDRYRGLCPFHSDSSPSFVVSPSSNRFHCFGCGERGSALDFYQKINHLDRNEAIKMVVSELAGKGRL